MRELVLNTARKSVIRCGTGAYERYAPEVAAARQCFIVSDNNVFSIYMDDIKRIFGENFKCFVLPAGEKSKTCKNLIAILGAMAEAGIKRSGCVVAFGGGVVGDIAGLAAALYMRGVHLVQIPTTLLAQVDSSVGGKTAVDYGNIKNLIGTFYQPDEVIVDPTFLQTLPEREIRCGLGEIIKYGALDCGIYGKLKRADSPSDIAFSEEIIYDCIAYKADVVQRDENDLNGIRKGLNLGHTTGHAFELYYRRKSHGEFVLIGMYYELFIARSAGVIDDVYKTELEELILKVMGSIPAYRDVELAAEAAKSDKKNTDDKISIVVPQREGKWVEMVLTPESYAYALAACRDSLKEKNENA